MGVEGEAVSGGIQGLFTYLGAKEKAKATERLGAAQFAIDEMKAKIAAQQSSQKMQDDALQSIIRVYQSAYA